MALVDGDTLVYLTARQLESGDEVRWELGAIDVRPPPSSCAGHRALCGAAFVGDVGVEAW